MTDLTAIIDETLSAGNTFTSWLQLRGERILPFGLLIDGTWAGTLTVQIRKPGDAEIVDLETHTANTARLGEVVGSHDVRVGFKSGEYSSGDANIRITR